jgi:hypothetical protein
MRKEPTNRNLNVAKATKQDEFYTQYEDIQNEIEACLRFDPDTFRDKTVYCNCDDPFESNFFKYFAINFNRLGLKQLITTCYDGSLIVCQETLFSEYEDENDDIEKRKAIAVILEHVEDENGDGSVDLTDVELFLKRNEATQIVLKGSAYYPAGDFRSPECVEFLKQADIIVTNPPFSLFRKYIALLMKHEKKFIIVGNINAITYKEVFPLIKENKIWFRLGFSNGYAYFRIPTKTRRDFSDGVYDESTGLVKFGNVGWFTNLDYGRRRERLSLMTMEHNLRFSKHKEIRGKAAYDRYDNYDAIEVPYTDAIPSDYDGVMGVPITFIDKYNPEQFEILGCSGVTQDTNGIYGSGTYLNGKETFKRLFIRHRHSSKDV